MNEWEWGLLEDRASAESLCIGGVDVKPGDRVRLRPGKRGDILDIALDGKIAMIEAIEQDYEGKFHLAVVADDDPGRDIGLLRQPGHRFFFAPDEVEPIAATPVAKNIEQPQEQAWNQSLEGGRVREGQQAVPESAAENRETNHGQRGHRQIGVQLQTQNILIACIGNIFLGDDGFGVEVARRLANHGLPQGVRVVDFGIRGLDLVYALLDGADVTILVDACPRGGTPGSLYVIEPDLNALGNDSGAPGGLDPHGMNPLNVLRMAKTMGGTLKRVLLVGCEPETLGPEEGQLGLSATVAAASEEAVTLIDSVVQRVRNGEWLSESAQS